MSTIIVYYLSVNVYYHRMSVPGQTILIGGTHTCTNKSTNTYSLWSVKLATLFPATGGFGSAINVEYVDFVPQLGW